MKKIILFVLIFVFSLSSCGNNNAKKVDTTGSGQVKKQEVGVPQPNKKEIDDYLVLIYKDNLQKNIDYLKGLPSTDLEKFDCDKTFSFDNIDSDFLSIKDKVDAFHNDKVKECKSTVLSLINEHKKITNGLSFFNPLIDCEKNLSASFSGESLKSEVNRCILLYTVENNNCNFYTDENSKNNCLSDLKLINDYKKAKIMFDKIDNYNFSDYIIKYKR